MGLVPAWGCPNLLGTLRRLFGSLEEGPRWPRATFRPKKWPFLASFAIRGESSTNRATRRGGQGHPKPPVPRFPQQPNFSPRIHAPRSGFWGQTCVFWGLHLCPHPLPAPRAHRPSTNHPDALSAPCPNFRIKGWARKKNEMATIHPTRPPSPCHSTPMMSPGVPPIPVGARRPHPGRPGAAGPR